MPLVRSWVPGANDPDGPFPLNNLPLGVFAPAGAEPRCGVAIGDAVLDARAAEGAGLLSLPGAPLMDVPRWNRVMAAGPAVWADLRTRLAVLLAADSPHRDRVEPLLHRRRAVSLHLPFRVAEFTDFYAGRCHAENVGTMFRGPEHALPPNWLHMPIGYNGRASSVVVSGTPVRRPWGQVKGADDAMPAFRPSRRFDFELELGAIVGTPSHGPVTVDAADAMIFGHVLLNDWSARDIQAWEYQPLGPFQSKATATTIGPWIVMADALRPFRRPPPARDTALLPHLADSGAMFHDIDLCVTLSPDGQPATTITRTNARALYFSAAQQLAHHASAGCPMRTGDLLGSGTISGPVRSARGSLLELGWGGQQPLTLDCGATRSFLADGDTVTLHGAARGEGYCIGFGACTGRVLPALADPFAH